MREVVSKIFLKPCPLCGHEKPLFYAHDRITECDATWTAYTVRCPMCNVKISRMTAKGVADAWNKRVRVTDTSFGPLMEYETLIF